MGICSYSFIDITVTAAPESTKSLHEAPFTFPVIYAVSPFDSSMRIILGPDLTPWPASTWSMRSALFSFPKYCPWLVLLPVVAAVVAAGMVRVAAIAGVVGIVAAAVAAEKEEVAAIVEVVAVVAAPSSVDC